MDQKVGPIFVKKKQCSIFELIAHLSLAKVHDMDYDICACH